ncbi:MAG: DUF5518 domain-containing protein [Candidatus Micrarchaeales archaeon]|nr:DUF5518 domain-containing protein [Candidatus Micrarchaeales archaeon]
MAQNSLVMATIVALVITIVFGLIGLFTYIGWLGLVGIFIAGLVAGWMVKDFKNGAISGFVGPAVATIIVAIIEIAYFASALGGVGGALVGGFATLIVGVLIIGAIIAGVIGLVGGLVGAYIGKSKK